MSKKNVDARSASGTSDLTRRDFIAGASVAGAVLLSGSAAASAASPTVESQTHVPVKTVPVDFAADKHDPRPTCAAATPDGSVVTCDDKGFVYLWNPSTMRKTVFKKLRKIKASYVTVSKTGKIVVLTASFDGVVSVSELANPQKRLRLFDDHLAETGGNTQVWAVAVTPDGANAVSGTNGGEIRYWDVDQAQTIAADSRMDEPIGALAFLPDGKHFLSGHGDGKMFLWAIDDTNPSDVKLTILTKFDQGTPLTVNSIAVFKNSNNVLQAITGSFDTIIRIWDMPADLANAPVLVTTPKQIISTLHKHFVWRVAASPDGTRFASVSEDHSVRFFDSTGTEFHAAVTGVVNGVMGVDFIDKNTVVHTTGVVVEPNDPDTTPPEIAVVKL